MPHNNKHSALSYILHSTKCPMCGVFVEDCCLKKIRILTKLHFKICSKKNNNKINFNKEHFDKLRNEKITQIINIPNQHGIFND